jgi:hypothetical protein
MDQKLRMEKKNKVETLRTERCENIGVFYISKIYIYLVIYLLILF